MHRFLFHYLHGISVSCFCCIFKITRHESYLLKKISAFLLTAILCNSVAYYGYFTLSMARVKFEAIQSRLDLDETAPGVLKVAVNKLDKDEDGEVWYQHKLYDVVKRKTINDITYVYILHDGDEEQLLTDNGDYFRDENGIFCATSFKLPHSGKTISLSDYQYILTAIQKINHSVFTSSAPAVKNEYFPDRFGIEVPTPPPKYNVQFNGTL